MPPQVPHLSSLAPQNGFSGQLVASSQEDPPQQQLPPSGGAGVVVVHLSSHDATHTLTTEGFVGHPAMQADSDPLGQGSGPQLGLGNAEVVAGVVAGLGLGLAAAVVVAAVVGVDFPAKHWNSHLCLS